MIYTFKLYGTHVAIDTNSGAVHRLDALAFDMLRYLVFPLEDNCLSTLRYDLARYESADVSATFAAFEKMSCDGVFSDCGEADDTYVREPIAKSVADVTIEYSGSRPIFATEVLRAVEGGARSVDIACVGEAMTAENADIVDAELERIAKDIAKRRLGKLPEPDFDFIPFYIDTAKDSNGYLRITDKAVLEVFRTAPEDAEGLYKRKCAECALMLMLL